MRTVIPAVLAALLLLPATAGAANVQWFPLPTADANLVDVTTGPDGNVWFAEQKGQQIGSITPAGQIAEYPGATENTIDDAGPSSIVNGNDGSLYFLTDVDSILGKMTPGSTPKLVFDNDLYPMSMFGAAPGGGVWMSFRHGTDSDHPDDDDGVVKYAGGAATRFAADYLGDFSPIVGTADGGAWYADGGKALKHVNAAGQTDQTLPIEGMPTSEEVTSIALDAAGTPWFTAYQGAAGWFQRAQGGSVGHVVGGKAVVTPLRDASLPSSMTLGPDGGMWFSIKGGVARTDASGVVKVAPLGIDSGSEMTFGSDGAIWFVDNTGNRIGRAAVDAALFPISKGARPVFRVVGGVKKFRKAKAVDVRCTISDPGSCSVTASVSKSVARGLKLGKTRKLGSGSASGSAAGEVKVKVKLSKKAVRALARVKRKVKVTLSVTVRGPQSLSSTKKTVALKR